MPQIVAQVRWAGQAVAAGRLSRGARQKVRRTVEATDHSGIDQGFERPGRPFRPGQRGIERRAGNDDQVAYVGGA